MANRLAPEKPKTYSLGTWQEQMQNMVLNKSTMDELVMDYLLYEGLYDAAQAFAQERGISESTVKEGDEQNQVNERQKIRRCIRKGDIDGAIELINNLDPEILDQNPKMYFSLYQQKFLELMRMGKLEEALQFVRENLIHIESDHELMREFSKTTEILLYEDPKKSPAGKNLLSDERLMSVASSTNQTLIEKGVHQQKEPILQLIFKYLMWGQKELRAYQNFPKIVDWNKMTIDFEENEKSVDLVQLNDEANDLVFRM
eukprot:TRINITY_DN1715_c1_g1_i2.p1 TRINITY_DN1715_c1_g1~~TRINITY_DN1715_c1_g1_i2.p1  ORF type:complete len:303 (-),score=33.74 TRINITY_DN1715_c1_g1_i2:1209-1982(-)